MRRFLRCVSLMMALVMLLVSSGCGGGTVSVSSAAESSSWDDSAAVDSSLSEESSEPEESGEEEEPIPAKTRMDRTRLNIGTYHLQSNARSEQDVQDLAAAGIDFVVGVDLDYSLLGLFDQYGIGAIVSGVLPSWWGGEGDNAGTLEKTNPLEGYASRGKYFADLSAVWGVDAGDEPSSLDFPYYGQVIDTVNRAFKNQFAYLNLYPNYANQKQLGTSYEDYIREYVEYVPTDYICYDYYMYSTTVNGAYENLRIVSDACLESDRSLWIVLQVNSDKEDEWTSANRMRFQAYTAMAYGAETILWACYSAGWWYNEILDKQGEKTEQYDKMSEVNRELHAFSDDYMRFRRIATHLVGYEETEWLRGVKQEAEEVLTCGSFADLSATDGSPLCIGEMTARDGEGEALFVVSADDPYDEDPQTHTVTFTCSAPVKAVGPEGEISLTDLGNGTFSFELASNQAVMLISE